MNRSVRASYWVLFLSVLWTIVPMVAAGPFRVPIAQAQGQTVTCESEGGQNAECKVSGGPVTLIRKLSKSPCTEGQTWGYNKYNKTVWVSNGCRAVFRVDHGEGVDHYVDGGWAGSSQLNREYYEEGYRRGREDAMAEKSMKYQRHDSDYSERFEPYFAQGYREGWNDQHAKMDMKPVPKTGGWTYPSDLDSLKRDYYRDGYMLGRSDARAHMSMAYERHSDHYDRRFEPYFQKGYEAGWKASRD